MALIPYPNDGSCTHWYRAGDGFTDIVNGNNGSAVGGLSTVADTEAGGESAWDYDGTAKYFTIPSTAALNLEGEWTMMWWEKLTASTAGTVHKRANPQTSTGWTTYTQTAAGGIWDFSQAGGNSRKTVTLPVGTWVHRCIVMRNNGGLWTPENFTDGVSIGTGVNQGVAITNTEPVIVGGRPQFSSYVNGRMDNLRFYNRVLTQEEITNLASARDYATAPVGAIDLKYGDQYNAEASNDGGTWNFPAGDPMGKKTGVRNLSNAPITVTFVAQAGEGFWSAQSQSASNQITDLINPGTQRMFQWRTGKGWVVDGVDTLNLEVVASLYGWAEQETDIPFDIPALSYVTLPLELQFPVSPLAPRGVTFDLGNDTFAVDLPGPWLLGTDFNIEGHDSSNQARTFFGRVYDVTADSPLSAGVTIGIGRNTEDTYINSVFPIQITPGKEGNALRVELGGGSAVLGGDLINGGVWLMYMGELGSLV